MSKTIAFTVYDKNNEKYALLLEKSFHYFHPDIPLRMFDESEVKKTGDPDIFYKQKPYFADKLFREGYETVIGMDSDMIVLGGLDHLLRQKGFDVGVVMNFNPLDFKLYGPITIDPIHYATEYFNAGFVIMKNHKFVRHWLKLCNGPFFKRVKYREQDLLNIMCHFGEYTYKCFDDFDTLTDYPPAWHGLLASSETLRAEVRGKDIVIPAGDNGYPNKDVLFKIWHPAGGQANHDKLNYRTKFQEDVVQRINEILA